MSHATILFDLDSRGEEQLAKAVRNCPMGGAIKLAGSGLCLRRIAGPVGFRLECPPKVKERPYVEPRALKSATTAAPALVAAHREVVGEVAS